MSCIFHNAETQEYDYDKTIKEVKMKELELSYYFKEINEFRFKDVFKNCKYPWEALANINKYIR